MSNRRKGGGSRAKRQHPAQSQDGPTSGLRPVPSTLPIPSSQGELAVTQPPQPVPTPEVYAAVAARRTQFDNLVWQVPVLSITAQAFLFTIALGADSRPVSRVIACLLSMIVTFLTVHIFTRHRQAEITDAHWLEEYEKRHALQPGGHGYYWRALREHTSADAGPFTPLARLRGYQTWAIGLSLFGVAALVVLVISIGWPQLLQK